ncbi:MAG: Smr/MutS family protein [Lewinellaceae bacterium]|nr:Smr/MutS family protein [Saprospiraceae bacterium]MCB9331627.1 Smr/MutS family protein [Lewinellaceae bacterium]
MLFAIGTKVRFRYTGETGTITSQLDNGMLQVRLDNDPDLEIPAFEEDLLRDTEKEPKLAGAKFVQGKQEPKPEAPPRREIKAQYVILKPKGVLIAFEPMPGRDGQVSRYKAWLVNDTKHEFIFELEVFIGSETLIQAEGKLAGTTVLELGDLLYDDLSDQPELEIRIQRITTDGPGEPLDRLLKIRPKQFFKNLQTAPILNVLTHQFVLFSEFEPKEKGPDENADSDLRDYTREHLLQQQILTEQNAVPYQAFDVEEFAHFEPEIDLHIENLTDGHAKLDKSIILRIQLDHFHRFLEKAIRLGVPRVFIVHGVGEGKLRESIAQELRTRPEVAKYKNEFHTKYGYGATEVIFH